MTAPAQAADATSSLTTDILIAGGGIAGLWLNARLRAAGFSTVVVEKNTLGGVQTLGSQGIIHGGIKYALSGSLTGASEAIADMPSRWVASLEGRGELDLQGVRRLSEAHYLWSPGSLISGLAGFFASKSVRGRAEACSKADLPEAFKNPSFKGKAYRLSEVVVDVPQLVARLVELGGDSFVRAEQLLPLREGGVLCGLRADGIEIKAQRVVLSAGLGNADLLSQLGLSTPQQQVRPLHQVLVKAPKLPLLYAHALGMGPKPRTTITSHIAADGDIVWNLGGDLAEADGVARDEASQIAFAKHELADLLPWVDLSSARFATWRVQRAEPAQNGLLRPDNAFLHSDAALMVAWPTKLALSPNLADQVLAALSAQNITPQANGARPGLPRPALGQAPWERLFA